MTLTSQIVSILDSTTKLPRWLFFVDDDIRPHHPVHQGHNLSLNVPPSDGVGYSNYSTRKPRLLTDLDLEPAAVLAGDEDMDETAVLKNLPGVGDKTTSGIGTGRDRQSCNIYTTRMLIWTLLVQVWIVWTPEAVHSVFLHLIFLAFVGVMMILKLHRFRLSTRCVKSGVVYTLTVLCAGCVLTLVAQPVFLCYEYLVKKVVIREYQRHLDRNPHVYVVASGLAIMMCVARGLHKHG